LRETLINLIENNAGPLLVNLSDVRYLDSAGLSILIAANRKSQSMGYAFGLSNPQTPVRQVFKLTRVDKVFQIFDTLAEGLAGLSGS
jgi:anti-sigma B factor antagonist